MRIKEIRITNFKSFVSEALLSLSPHANVVVGRNGAGKSSLVTAIHFLMCGEKPFSGEYIEYVHEGGQLGEENASVEIIFCNGDQRFPGQKEFCVKRSVGARKDEYMLDGRNISREELVGLFQSAGFAVENPYFIVLQGRIAELAVLNEKERYELIKSVAGASNYEKDREASICMLDETKQTEGKIELLLDRIEDRLRGLEKEKKEMEAYDELEKEKRKLEYAYAEREISELNNSIAQAESQIPEEDDESEEEAEENVSEMKSVKNEMERLLIERKELVFDEKYKDKEEGIRKEIGRAEGILSQLKMNRSKDEEQLSKLKESYGENFVNLNYLKYLIRFLSTLNGREVSDDEVEATRSSLKRKMNELRIDEGLDGQSVGRKASNGNLDYEVLVEKRKFLWREERRLESSIKSTQEMLRAQESKLLLAGNTALNVCQQIGGEKGVLGCIYDLVTIPDELCDAFEAVAGNSLFNVVVEDEEVASALLTRLGSKLKARITFMPLNRIESKEEEIIKDSTVISLTSQMRCDPKYRPLLKYITKNAYLCSDLKSAVYASKKYNINVVTLEGDFVSRGGPISGGYEKRSGFLRDYKKIHGEIMRQNEELTMVKEELKRVSHDIDEIKMYVDSDGMNGSMYGESLKAITLFLQEKLKILEEIRTGKFSGMNLNKLRDEEKDLEYKSICIGNEMRKLETRISEAEFEIRKSTGRLHILESEMGKARMYSEAVAVDARIAELRERERKLRESLFSEENKDLFAKPRKVNLEMEMSIAKKHMLINKRNELCERIGASDFRNLECLYEGKSKEDIVGELIKINEKIKRFPVTNKRAISQWESHISQKNSLKERLEELRRSKECISGFISGLDSRKEETIDLTLSMIKENFSIFYSKLANEGRAELCKCEAGVGIKINGNLANMNALSGGQKTVVALSLIFSIQKVDPSPFYVFDEMDANLDIQSRERVAALIEEMNSEDGSQFIITTFKKEMLRCGARFFGVEFNEKRSSVREIGRDAAYEFLSEEIAER